MELNRSLVETDTHAAAKYRPWAYTSVLQNPYNPPLAGRCIPIPTHTPMHTHLGPSRVSACRLCSSNQVDRLCQPQHPYSLRAPLRLLPAASDAPLFRQHQKRPRRRDESKSPPDKQSYFPGFSQERAAAGGAGAHVGGWRQAEAERTAPAGPVIAAKSSESSSRRDCPGCSESRHFSSIHALANPAQTSGAGGWALPALSGSGEMLQELGRSGRYTPRRWAAGPALCYRGSV